MNQEKPACPDSEAMQRMAALWVRHQPRVAGFITAAVPDFHAAEDLLQDVAVAVAKKFMTYDPERPFAPWVIGIARNCIAAYYRKTGTSKIIFADEVLMELSAAILRVDQDEIDERLEALSDCVRALRGESRRTVEERYLRARSVMEIAELLGTSASAVSVRLHRARKALEDCIARKLSGGRSQSPL